MKLESKQVSFPPEAETFEHIEKNLGSDVLKPGDDKLKENQNGVSVHDAKPREEDYVDQILYQTTDDEVARKDDDDSEDMDDLAESGVVELRTFVKPLPSILAHDRLTVRYEDNSNHVVKDICVDEGLPLHDKFLFDTNVDDEYVEYLSSFLSRVKAEKCGEVVKDSVVELIILDPIVRNSSGQGSENGEIRCEEAHNYEASGNSTGNNATKMSHSLGDSLILLEPGMDRSCHAPLSDQTSGVQQDSPQISKGHKNDSLQDSVPPASKESSPNAAVHEEDITYERHSLDSLPDELTHEVAARLSFDTKVDNATASTTTGNDHKIPPNDDPQQELKTLLVSSKIGSEPAPYSGSISMRSDSSTTSTRSFAFPVLQNEWNSSPVRMAKADRRNLRKHRHWRQSILCCKF